MADEKPKLSVTQIVCMAIGIIIGIVTVQNGLGIGGAIGGGLGGGLGALLGMGLFAVVNRLKGS